MSAIDWSGVRLAGIGADTVVVVTGGSGAIGAEVAAAFVAMGARVGLVARSLRRVSAVAAGIHGAGHVVAVEGDVSDIDSMRAAVATVTTELGPPSVLVNSAAVGTVAHSVDEVTTAEVDAILSVNVKGTLNAALACLPGMRAAGRGKIVNVASVGAHGAHVGHLIYGASKAAVIRLTKQLAVELGPENINANSVSPGQTPTRIRLWDESPGTEPLEATSKVVAGDRIPLRRRGEIGDYIGAIVFLSSALADYITGVDIPVEGGVLVAL